VPPPLGAVAELPLGQFAPEATLPAVPPLSAEPLVPGNGVSAFGHAVPPIVLPPLPLVLLPLPLVRGLPVVEDGLVAPGLVLPGELELLPPYEEPALPPPLEVCASATPAVSASTVAAVRRTRFILHSLAFAERRPMGRSS
jgi:hypothetical protein